MENGNYEGVVAKIGKPKLYDGPYGLYRKFFVEFEDGQHAMFAMKHYNTFKIGDIINIADIDTESEWLFVSDKKDCSTVGQVSANRMHSGIITSEFEIGYVTQLKEEGDEEFYLTYNPKPINGSNETLAEYEIKTIKFPHDIVWRDSEGIEQLPSFSEVKIEGEIVGKTFIVKAIIMQKPQFLEETIIIKTSSLNYHKSGADFYTTMNKEAFKGTIRVPFYSSIAYNLIKDQFPGHVEIHGIWIKRGFMKKVDGKWQERIYWQLFKGNSHFERRTVEDIQEIVSNYRKIDSYRNLINRITESISPMTFEEIQRRFEEANFTVGYDEIREFFWRQTHEESYISHLEKHCAKMLVSPNGNFSFVWHNGAIIVEIPSTESRTLIFKPMDDPISHIMQINKYKVKDILTNKEIQQELGFHNSLRHSEYWEEEVLAEILEVG